MKKLPKLYFTLQEAIDKNACRSGLDTFKKYLSDNNIKYTNKTKFNLLLLLESNSISDFFWMLKFNSKIKISLDISVTISKKAAARAVAYARAAPDAPDAAVYARNAAVSWDAARDAAVCAATRAATRAAVYARDAAVYARDAAVCARAAAFACDDAACDAERQQQIEDIKQIIGE